ncbi:hypothetical protein LEP1GSC193_0781 [Leptospira phage vB_LalZ_80412-LE1]|uniref:Uncharacterized protein n=1 Tax=Leptospira alstonii serovar Sichuan str. 79601 TaxID=1218565 RepID=M6CYF0_9LEPT|nr:hypothetical protein LEP1GSC193_0781 [Leptospira phage vB_LalZ_80412-LE1]EMJ95521.1 hypothetical protein LEP1GSC194_3581 [Leptospira alstonii serovar Sichuan str. 79601]
MYLSSVHILEVGKLYHPNKTKWQEGAFYQCAGGEHRLELFFNSPSPKEIKSVKSGTASFGFLVQDELICFLFRFYPDFDWFDSPSFT